MAILYKKWTDSEVAMITDKPNDVNVTDKSLSKALGRSVTAIRSKRYRLGQEIYKRCLRKY